MKKFPGSFLLIILLLLWFGCTGKGPAKKDTSPVNDTVSSSDTGFTGIKQYMSSGHLIMETTFKNGIKEGIMKTYYLNGKLRRTYWYENGSREDTSNWYYEEGQIFRQTPYKKDTADGIQKQFFRNGKLRAQIGYKKGLRTTYFEEYSQDGQLIKEYPGLDVSVKDNYKSTGTYRIILKLSDKSTQVRFYRGDLGKGIFDTAHYSKINVITGSGILDLKKTGKPQQEAVDIIAEILTGYGNNYLLHKKIALPYKDLN